MTKLPYLTLILFLAGLTGCKKEQKAEVKPCEPEIIYVAEAITPSAFQLSEVHQVSVFFDYNDGGESHYFWMNGNHSDIIDPISVSTSGIITVDLKKKRKYTMEVYR